MIKEEQPKLRAQGKKVGIGLVFFTENTGVGPYEGAKITVGNSGKVFASSIFGTQGQGHFTSLLKLLPTRSVSRPEDVIIETGDTDKFAWGTGTFASRGATVSRKCLSSHSQIWSEQKSWLQPVNCSMFLRMNWNWVMAKFAVADIPGKSIKLGDLAIKANPMRGTIKPGTEPGLKLPAFTLHLTAPHLMVQPQRSSKWIRKVIT